MSADALPAPVQQFIRQHVSSIEQLEVLQLLAGSPGSQWTAPAVFKAVLTNVDSIERLLKKFADAGFIVKTDTQPPAYHFAPAPEIAGTITELCKLYTEKSVRVIEAIYKDRSAIQEFANAFKFKSDP